jgi:ABC-type multidrug transport system ATPase subunit
MMPTQASASPLTVWLGPTRYVFPPGRDVLVGVGPGVDIPLDVPGGPAAARPDVVLRFTGSHWVAIDGGARGLFVDGSRVSTVDIHSGQAITIGDPQRGPRLVFGIGPPPGPVTPSERDTQRMRVPTPQPPVAQPPVAQDELPEGPGLIERMITRRLRAPNPSFRTQEVQEGNSTFRLPLRSGARTSGVAAHRLGHTVDGNEVLTDISFTAPLGTLTAVVGPSAARNSALLELLAGTRELSSGRITVDGHDVHAEPESMRTRIGTVGRDECVHPRLTVEQALGYAAELRLPPDTAPEHQKRVVEQVLEEVGLTPHRATRIAKLPPEVRRCVALAVELITRPTLLVVDDPGAGLDPVQQDRVMAVLRRQADIGCVVVVAVSPQTSLGNLDVCDQVLTLTAKGAMAHAAAPPTPPEVAAPWPRPAGLGARRQIRLLVRRQLRLAFADPIHVLFLAVLPFVLAALALLIPGDSGLARPGPGDNPHEAIEILAALNIAAVLVGTALTIRTLVNERRVFRREQAVGLSAPAYLAAKLVVFGVAALVLTAVFFAIVVVVKGGPVHGAVLLGNATLELYVSVALTALVSAIVGLALSAMGNRLREVLPLLVPVVLASLLFNGSLVELVSKWGFQQVSWFVPAQWGFAASASVVDLRRVDALAANTLMWSHYSGWWVFDVVMLVVFGAIAAGFVLFRLRSPRPGRA